MRALLTDGRTAAFSADAPDPQPEPGEAIVRPTRVAVTPLDVEASRGLNDFRGVLGHEFVGVIDDVAEGGPARAGARVVANPDTACGRCDLCQGGLATHCRDRATIGVAGRDGCLAERIALPARNLVPVPDEVDDDAAVFAVTVARALQSVRQLTIEGRPYVTVLGATVLGLVTAQLMAKLNATVRLVGEEGDLLARCDRWGIKHRPRAAIGHRADQDIVVDCTEGPKGLASALPLVRPRGTVVLKSTLAPRASGEEPDVRGTLNVVVNREVRLVGSRLGSLREAVGLLARREVDTTGLIGSRGRLEDGAKLLDAAADPGRPRVVVDVSRPTRAR